MKRNNGFALIEILIVVAIIAGIGITYYTLSSDKNAGEITSLNPETICLNQCNTLYGIEVSVSRDACVAACAQTTKGNNNSSGYQGNVIAGNTAPLLEFHKADYEAAKQSDKLVVLYFYANWCPICKKEVADALYPAFNELTRDDVIGFRVNFNDDETDADEKDLAREFGVAYQHTKVFVKNSERILKSPEAWTRARYATEIDKAI